MTSNFKPRWLSVVYAIGILLIYVQLAVSYPSPPCNTSCSAWSCVPGSINNPGTLNVANITICVGGSASVSVNGTTFHNGSKSRQCNNGCGSSWTDGPYNITYTPTYSWDPPLPTTFPGTGTFVYTCKVMGLSSDSDCPTATAPATVGTLTVFVTTSAPPYILIQPSDQTVCWGKNATFSVVADGCPSVGYQWRLGQTAIVGATNATLTLTNVQFNQSGIYTVLVTNLNGWTLSTNALLTVEPPQPCDPAPTGLVSWWPGEGNASDIMGINNGTPVGNLGYASGEVGQAFVFDGSTSYIKVPASTSLNIGTGGGITIEGWIMPASGSTQGPIVEWDSSDTAALELWVQPGLLLFANLRDTSGNNHIMTTATGLLSTTAFQHVALTYNKSTGVAVIYLNGTPVLTTDFGIFTPQTTYPVNIGRRTGEAVGLNQTYSGLIDELSLYNRALLPNEIAAIYQAGVGGKCAPGGPPVIVVQPPANQTVNEGENATFSVTAVGTMPLSYQWQLNSANIPNATGPSYTKYNVQPADSGDYRVIVHDGTGLSVTSSIAHLTVLVSPSITTQPVDTIVTYGQGATFGVTSTGAVGYQWKHNGTDVPRATSNEYPVSKPQVADSGSTYSVVVYGANGGYVISRSAVLTVKRAILTVAVNSPLSRAYGQANPSSWHYSGFVNGDDQSVINGAPILSTPATPGSPVAGSPYPIQISAGNGGVPSIWAANYSFNFVNGSLTVTKANLTVTADNKTKAIGAANPLLTGVVTPPLVLTDGIAVGYVTAATTGSPAGTYPIIPTFSDPNGKLVNYNLTINNGTLTISAAPLITVQPISITRAPLSTSTATFTVQAAGSPTLLYQWSKNNQQLSDVGNISGSTTPTLTLTGILTADEGNYSVSVRNGVGTINSATATLTVTDPAVTNSPQNHYTVPGGTVTFDVKAQSSCNPPGYQWNKDGTITLSDGIQFPGIAKTISGSTAAELDLQNITANAGGNYQAAVSCNGTTTTGPGGTLTVCDLYPIAMNTSTVLGHKDGDSITVSFNNTSSTQGGLFSWLSWSGATADSTLESSFTMPDSYNYVNPLDSQIEPPVDSGKWVSTETGTKANVLSIIANPVYNLMKKSIAVVVWDQYNPAYGQHGAIRVYSFARITITAVNPNGDNNSTLTYTLDGIGRCNDECYPPTITLSPGNLIYTENQPPQVVDYAASIADLGDQNYSGWILTVGFAPNGLPEDDLSIQNQGTAAGQIGLTVLSGATDVTYGGVTIGNVIGSLGGNVLQVEFNSSANREAVTALLQNLTYQDTSLNPSTLNRTLTIVMNNTVDSNCASTPVDKTIQVVAVNDPPTLAQPSDISIPSCGGPVTVQLSGIAAGGNKNQVLNVSAISSTPSLIPNPAVTYSSPNSTGTLTLSPTGTGFGGPVQITVTVQETGGGTVGGVNYVNRTFNVTVLDCAPVIAFETPFSTFTEHAQPLIIDPNFSASDADSPNFNGGSFTVDFGASGQPGDLLLVQNQGTGPGQIGVSITSLPGIQVTYSITYGGTGIGGGVGVPFVTDNKPLVIELNANATPAAVQALARSLMYQNGSDTPSILTRTVRVVVNDGGGGISAPTTTSIYVLPVNDPPVAEPDLYSIAPDGRLVVDAAHGVLANDTDSEGDALTAALASQPSYGTLTLNSDGSFTYQSESTTATQDTFTYTATDNGTSGRLVNGTVQLFSDPKSTTPTMVTIKINQPSCTTPTIGSITLDGSTVDTVTGGSPVTGVVTLSDTTTLVGGQVINLISSSDSAVPPIAVRVLPNTSSAQFTIQTRPVSSETSVAITASYPNQSSPPQATLKIEPSTPTVGGLPTGVPLGFRYSLFADGFESSLGDGEFVIGMVKNSLGQLLITIPNAVYSYPFDPQDALPAGLVILPDQDGQHYDPTVNLPVQLEGIYGLTKLEGKIYGADHDGNSIVELSDSGQIVSTLYLGNIQPVGLAANPKNGLLYATTTSEGIYEIDPNLGSVRLVAEKNGADFDGIAISLDGQTVYGADVADSEIEGYDIVSGALVFSVYLPNGWADGIVIGQGSLSGKLFGNGNGLWEIDLNTQTASLFAQQLSEGDFVMADEDGSLLITQLGEILRLTPPPAAGFSALNGIICTRNDDTTSYTPISLGTSTGISEAVSKEIGVFDLSGISGSVTSAYMSRGGTASYNADEGLEIEYGIAPSDPQNGNAKDNSYPPQTLLAAASQGQASANYPTVAMPWQLSTAYLQDLQLGLGAYYQIKLADRISSICETVSLTDTPQSQWPQTWNTLTFLVTSSSEPQIPAGNCLDIALFGADNPQNGDWDIFLDGQIIASSGNPNGWNVEMDQTPYQGAFVSVPLSASVAPNYKVRTAGSPAKSANFEVVPPGGILRAPILLPIALSANPASAGGSVNVTITLDQPAPAAGATVALKCDNSSVSTPTSVTIPPGETSQTITVSIAANPSPDIADITASYNGQRRVALRISTCAGSPPSQPTISASSTAGNLTLNWSAVSGALTYNVKRSTSSGGPYTTIFTGLNNTVYADNSVVNGLTYYYVVSGQNDCGEGPNSTEASATRYLGQVNTPVITPNGTTVSITDTTFGAIIRYTLDGSEPTEGSPVYQGPFTLVVKTPIIKAKAYKLGYSPSATAEASFTPPSPYYPAYSGVNCGDIVRSTLDGNASEFSVQRGSAFYARHFVLDASTLSPGDIITITMSSSDLNSALYLMDDPNGQDVPLAQSEAGLADGSSMAGSRIEYVVPQNKSSTYYIEATSEYPGQTGNFMLYVSTGHCPPSVAFAAIKFDGSTVAIGNNGVNNIVDVGPAYVGTTPVAYVTINNSSPSVSLDVQSVQVAGDFVGDVLKTFYGGFTQLNTLGLPPIPPNGTLNVPIRLASVPTGADIGSQKKGTITIQHNAPGSPFVFNITATVTQNSPPNVLINSPQSNTSSSSGVTILATANSSLSAIAKVDFFESPAGQNSFTKVGEADLLVGGYYTCNWLNAPAGTYDIEAIAADTAGRSSVPAVVNSITVTAPTLSGMPSFSAFGTPPQGSQPPNTYQGSVSVTISPDSTWQGKAFTIFYSTDGGVHWYVYNDSQPIILTYQDPNAENITVEARGVVNGLQSATASDSYTIVAPPATTHPPVAEIVAPPDATQTQGQITGITAPTDVKVTAKLDPNDAGDSFASWRVEYHVHIDSSSPSTANGPWVTFASGQYPVTASTVAKFDPTLLLNGLYDIRLTVVSAAGYVTTDTATVEVNGQQKVGNFTLSFVDMTVPVAGIPIQVTRTYDSRDKSQGDFGIGWRLGLNNITVQKSGSLGTGWGEASVFFGTELEVVPRQPHRVTISFPGDKVYSFEETLNPPVQGSSVMSGNVEFTALPGTPPSAKLVPVNVDTSVDVNLSADNSGAYEFDVQGTSVQIPFDANEFDLTTPDGRIYRVNVGSGLEQITDLNGNVITFKSDGIYKNKDSTSIISYPRPNGLINTITDPNGKFVKYTYGAGSANPNGAGIQSSLDLATVTDRDGHVTTFYYDSMHGLLDVIAPDGSHGVRNVYDDNGRLTETIDALNNITTYQYNVDGGNTETIIDPLQNKTVLHYDINGNVTQKTQTIIVNGILTTVTTASQFADPNNPNKPTSVTDALNRTTTMHYDVNGDLLNETDPAQHTTSYLYNDLGQVKSITDAKSRPVVQNQYDFQGNLTSTIDANGAQATMSYNSDGTLKSSTDALLRTTQYTYGETVGTLDPNTGNTINVPGDPGNTGQPTTITDPNVHATHYVYDSNGNQTHVVTTRTLNDNSIETIDTVNQYNGSGQLTETIVYAHIPGKSVQSQVQVRNFYNTTTGKLDYSLDSTSQQTTYLYDPAGRLISTTTPDNVSKITDYDQDGRMISTTVDATALLGGKKLITSYTYDSLGRQTSVTHPDGSVTSQAYDAAGQLTGTTDADNNTTTYEYDDAGRNTKVIDALNHVTAYEYDEVGQKVSMTDANGNQTLYAYDNDGRVVTTTFPDITTQTTIYNIMGRKVAKKDQAGVITGYGYDFLGRLAYVTNAFHTSDQAVTHYVYDEVGNLTKQYDANQFDPTGNPVANQVATVFDYDYLGRRTGRTLPAGQSETIDYSLISNPNGSGQVLQTVQTDFNGNKTTIDDDVMGRVASETPDSSSSLSAAGKIPITFAYDPTTGQRYTMTDASGTTTYTYDDLGRLVTKVHSVVGELDYTYDPNGNLLTIKDGTVSRSGGVSLTYHWDALNRLSQVDDNKTKSTTYTYDKVGNLQTFTYPTTTPIAATYKYNALNRLTSVNATAGSSQTPFASFGYTLGLSGNRMAVSETIGTTISRSVNYFYDNLYRLTKEQIVTDPVRTGAIDYSNLGGGNNGYDRVGNRQSRVVSLSPAISGFNTVDSTFDDDDRLNSSTSDANGNTTVETLPTLTTLPTPVSPTTTYPDQYDFQNNLIQRGDATIKIVYDGDGNRVEKIVNGVTTYYLVDDRNPSGHAQVLEELNGSMQVNRVYNYGLALTSQESGGATIYYGYDGHGNVRFLTDNAGNITDTYTYDAFGELLAKTGTTPNNYLYCGEQYDPDLGLYYLRARYMNPGDGRFWTMDSYEGDNEDPLSLHKYLYGRDNPVDNVDPSGHDLISLSISMSIGSSLDGTYNGVVAITGDALQNQIRYGGNSGIYTILLDAGFMVGGQIVMKVAEGGSFVISKIASGFAVRQELSAFRYAADYGVLPAKMLYRIRKAGKMVGDTEIHHLIEQRFVGKALKNGIRAGDIPGVVLTPAEHEVFTQAWRRQIGYNRSGARISTSTATIDDIWNACKNVYAEYPDLLEYCRKFLGK